MFGLFLSIATVIASVTTGLLLYLSPKLPTIAVKGTAIASPVSPVLSISLSPSPTLSPAVIDTSPTTLPDTPTPIAKEMPQLLKPTVFTPPLTPSPSPTMIPIATNMPIPSFSPTPTLTVTPVPLHLVSSVLTPSPLATSAAIGIPKGLRADVVFQLVNDHRKSIGLPLFQKDDKTCEIANARAPQVYDEIFVTGNIDGGLHPKNYPFYLTETIISNNTEANAVAWWLDESFHRQILEGNYIYSCVACWGYSCAEIYTSYISR